VDGSRKEQRPVPADQLSEFSERVMTHEQKTPHANCNLQAEYAGSVKEAPDKPSFAPIPIHSVPKADRKQTGSWAHAFERMRSGATLPPEQKWPESDENRQTLKARGREFLIILVKHHHFTSNPHVTDSPGLKSGVRLL
jgi:hypothetical protein